MSKRTEREVIGMEHRYDVEPSMGRGWRAECDCGWLSPVVLTLSAAHRAGDHHIDNQTT